MNPLKGEVSFSIGGEAYVLVYDIDALIVLENELDMSVLEFGEKLSGTPRIGFMRVLLWGGLLRHRPKFTLQEAGALLMALKVQTALEYCAQALTLAFPGERDGEDASAPADPQPAAKPARGTGRASSPSGSSSD